MKLVLKIIAALVMLVVAAALLIPMFISAEYLKGELVAQVKKATGRDLTIEGTASLSVFPNLAVHVENVTLGNPEGFASPYFLRIGKLETGAALMPLLGKELRITGVTLEGATINLEENASGSKNWEFTKAEKEPGASDEQAPEVKKASPLKALAIGEVAIKDSSISYRKGNEKPVAVEGITVGLTGVDGTSPLVLSGKALLRGEPVEIALDIKSMPEFLQGRLVPTKLALGLPSGKVGFAGEAGMKGAEYGAAGTLDIAISDVQKLQAWATGKPAKPAFPKSVKLTSAIKASGVNKTIVLDTVSAELNALKATGNLTAVYGGAVPALKGTLTIPELDLAAISKPVAPGAAGGGDKAAPAANSSGWSDAPIDTSGLRAANADMVLSIGSLKSDKFQISDIAATIALKGGVLGIDLGKASLYGGSAKGNVKLDGSAAGVGLTTDLDIADVQIDPLMTALSGASKLEGTATVTLDVNGRGASQRAIVSSLGGKGSMRIADGAIKGINIASFLRSAQKGFVLGEKTTEKTDFTELTATFLIAKGIVSNEDLSMKSPVLRLAGKGIISLPPRTIDYRLVPTLVGSIEGQGGKDGLSGIAVPLIITGPWSAISVTPDLAGMLEEGLKNPEALKQNLKGIKDTIGDYNSPKDIGKALLGGGKAKEATPETTAPAPATGAAPAPTAPLTKEQKIEQGIGGLLNTFGK